MAFDWRGFFLGGLGKSPDPNASQFGDRPAITSTIAQGIAGAQNRPPPQAGNTQIGPVSTAAQADMSGLRQVRGQQLGMVDDLGRIASGQMQGAGELAAQRAGQVATGNALGSATMARGANAAGAGRAAARAAAGIGLATAGQAQQAAMGDQAAANAARAGILGQVAGQDLGAAGMAQQVNLANMDARNRQIFEQAGLNQATSLANMQARLQAMGMNDAAILGYLGQLTGMNAAELQARMGQEQASMAQTGVLGSLVGGAGSILGKLF